MCFSLEKRSIGRPYYVGVSQFDRKQLAWKRRCRYIEGGLLELDKQGFILFSVFLFSLFLGIYMRGQGVAPVRPAMMYLVGLQDTCVKVLYFLIGCC